MLNQNLTSQSLMKRIGFFFGLFLTFFLRLQIYEAIAAIFWQFTGYVLKIVKLNVFRVACGQYGKNKVWENDRIHE